MAVVVCDDLDVCMDCAMLLANDEATDEHRAAFAAHRAQGQQGQMVLDGESDVDDTPFSTVRCDGCGSTDAGYRTSAAILL